MKSVIVTGASSGIGKSTKELLEDNGYDVVSISRSTGFDLSDIKSLELTKEILEKDMYGIVNNSAICIKKELSDYTIDDFYYTMNLNLLAPFLLTKMVLPSLKKNKGSIVNVSSIHSISTIENNGFYAASKAALESLTRSMAIEFSKYQIRVNCVRPGSIMTPMLGYVNGMEKSIPLGHIGEPIEIANVICFLLDKKSSYVNGECITVDGGVLSKLSVIK